MSIQNEYLKKVLADVIARNPGESEFHQTVSEVLESLEPVVEQSPIYIERGIIDMLSKVKRFITAYIEIIACKARHILIN